MSKTDEYECPLLECDVTAPDDNDKDALTFIKKHLRMDHPLNDNPLFITVCPLDCNEIVAGTSVADVKSEMETHLGTHNTDLTESDPQIKNVED